MTPPRPENVYFSKQLTDVGTVCATCVNHLCDVIGSGWMIVNLHFYLRTALSRPTHWSSTLDQNRSCPRLIPGIGVFILLQLMEGQSRVSGHTFGSIPSYLKYFSIYFISVVNCFSCVIRVFWYGYFTPKKCIQVNSSQHMCLFFMSKIYNDILMDIVLEVTDEWTKLLRAHTRERETNNLGNEPVSQGVFE